MALEESFDSRTSNAGYRPLTSSPPGGPSITNKSIFFRSLNDFGSYQPELFLNGASFEYRTSALLIP